MKPLAYLSILLLNNCTSYGRRFFCSIGRQKCYPTQHPPCPPFQLAILSSNTSSAPHAPGRGGVILVSMRAICGCLDSCLAHKQTQPYHCRCFPPPHLLNSPLNQQTKSLYQEANGSSNQKFSPLSPHQLPPVPEPMKISTGQASINGNETGAPIDTNKGGIG